MKRRSICYRLLGATVIGLGLSVAPADDLDPQQLEEKCKITCGNLTYAGDQSSVCFSDHFLQEIEKQTSLKVHPKFKPLRLGEDELFETPFCVWSGEKNFTLTEKERRNLKAYIEGGGFIVASPGCSSDAWDRAFRKELAGLFPETALEKIPMTHEVFQTVNKISELRDKSRKPVLLEGLTIGGRLALIYSPEGLNDSGRAKGCCCCGGNEVREAVQANVNILTYVLLY